MAMPKVEMRSLLEAGVHFGHQSHRWNPRMAPYIFGERNGIHILDLSQTVPFLVRALTTVRETVSGGGRVLFVGTKRQASSIVADAAKRSGQYYVNHRWLGGMLTNWQTISQSIKRLKAFDEKLSSENTGLTKKETLQLTRQRDKLELSLGGIQDMGALPDLVVVMDVNRDELAVAEANRLNIPVVGILDTNSNPDGIDFPVPGNDDATRAIRLYCDLIAEAVLDGIQAELSAQGIDLGAAEEAPEEVAVVEVAQEAQAASQEAPAATEEAPVKEKAKPAAKAKPAKEKIEAKAKPAAKAKAKAKPAAKEKTEATAKPAKAKAEAKAKPAKAKAEDKE